MISNIPSASDLQETASNWMILAWAATIDCLKEVQAWKWQQEGREVSPAGLAGREAELVKAQRYHITNALSLLQQSLELFLKSRVASVSPFLLISGDPSRWPAPDKDTNVLDFSRLRTVDAVDLVKLVNVVCDEELPKEFVDQYHRLRTERNKVIHLDTGRISFEAGAVGYDILAAHNALFPNEPWQRFRRDHFAPPSKHEDDEYELDFSYDGYSGEISVMLEQFDPLVLKRFLGYDEKLERVDCPSCYSLTTKHYFGSHEFAQISNDGSIFCIACTATYADIDELERAR